MIFLFGCLGSSLLFNISTSQNQTYIQTPNEKTEIIFEKPYMSIIFSSFLPIGISIYIKDGDYKFITDLDDDNYGYFFGSNTGKIVIESKNEVNVSFYTLAMKEGIDYYISLTPSSVFEIGSGYSRNVSLKRDMKVCYWSPSIETKLLTISYNLEREPIFNFFNEIEFSKGTGRGYLEYDTERPNLFCWFPQRPKKNLFIYIKSISTNKKNIKYFISAIRPSSEPQVIRNIDNINIAPKDATIIEFSIIILLIVIINFVTLIIIRFQKNDNNEVENELINFEEENLSIDNDKVVLETP